MKGWTATLAAIVLTALLLASPLAAAGQAGSGVASKCRVDELAERGCAEGGRMDAEAVLWSRGG
jgi:hypothetical protein